MNWDFLKPLLQGWATNALAGVGAAMGLTGEGKTQFVGAGMVILSFVWEWWKSRGAAMVEDEVKRLRETKIITPANPPVQK